MSNAKIFTILMAMILIFILNLPNHASANVENGPSIDYQVTPSQAEIVKPQTGNANGSLNMHLIPKGSTTNANREPIDVVFIFDKSGSMNEAGRNPAKFQSAKNAMDEAVRFFKEQAGPNDRFAFIPFSSAVELGKMVYFSPNHPRESLDLINETAQSLTAVGGTNYTQSFESAMDMFGGGSNNKYIIFMTDGEPTVSSSRETVTYNEKKCYFFDWFCRETDNKITGEVTVNYELYGLKPYTGYRAFFEAKGIEYDLRPGKDKAVNAIRRHALNAAQNLAKQNIKLFSIGFGNQTEVDIGYLRELSAITGVTARQASQETIASVFRDISADIDSPSISGEVLVDIGKFAGKVIVPEGSNARVEGNLASLKFNFNYPVNQGTPQPLDLSLPLDFSETGTYTFDNIKLKYTNLSGEVIVVPHPAVTLEVKADAPPGFKGTMDITGAVNSPDHLIKVTGSADRTNEFKVEYSLEPNGLVNSTVSGSLSNIKLIQPLPDGITLIPSEGVENFIFEGRPAARISVADNIHYSSGSFRPEKLIAALNLKAEWAVSNVKMPLAHLQYTDSRFGDQQTTITASNQVINMKVRLHEFPANAYDGDAAGIITKTDLSQNGRRLGITEFPNDYGLKNKPIKEMIFKPGSANRVVEITYFDNEKVNMYLAPDYRFTGINSGETYEDGMASNENINMNLVHLVAGKGARYYYSIENVNGNTDWTGFSPQDTIPVTASGLNKVKVKAEGGFAIPGCEVIKTITIQKQIDSMTVAPNPIEIETGKTIAFTVNIGPADASNQQLEMEIADRSIADFSGDHHLFGRLEGRTVLTVRAKDGSGIAVTVPIIVKDPYIALEELKFRKAVFKIGINEKIAVTDLLIFNPENATGKSIELVTSEMGNKVAAVLENGRWYLVGKEIGYSNVTARAEEQRTGKKPQASALFEVTVDGDGGNSGSEGAGRW
ncbi:hypothetical protein CU633_20785 [Bacillus sp. V3-13]|uniref:VWA domain-containing protein n=1 Tax=Bacillus sp. V3-13 TaxID=2053728 RepID=UPI000C75AC1B|nr:VWA domain-containing protein [Bacillus sp. V3-13]PLR75494.1 hypothetical protein CU633_20785 [Bacillus sp. V3-13]